MHQYKIADLVVQITMNEKYIHENLLDFTCEGETPDLEWNVITGSMPDFIDKNPITSIGNITLCKVHDKVILHFPDIESYDIQMIVFTDQYKKADFYLPKGYPDHKSLEEQMLEKEHIFAFFREAFFAACLSYNGFSIHSASIIYKNKGYVFSGCSGTGKSTHTNMWKSLFPVEILDGDVTIVRLIQDKAFVYGLPWCGTSKLYTNTRVELGSIFFLKQSPTNRIYQPETLEAFDRLFARSFTPMWYEELVETRMTLTEKVIAFTPIHVLYCLPNHEAVYMAKAAID